MWYHVEYARSNRSRCKEFRCKRAIEKDELRIGLKQEENDHMGEDLGWFCFCDSFGPCLWKTFNYRKNSNPPITDISHVNNLQALTKEDRAKIRALVARRGAAPKASTGGASGGDGPKKRTAAADAGSEPAKKKRAADKAAKGPPPKVVAEMEKLSVDQLKALLRTNDQNVTGTKGQLVARAADGKAFGALPRCPTCHGGRIKYEGGVYSCPGFMDDDVFHKCSFQAPTI